VREIERERERERLREGEIERRENEQKNDHCPFSLIFIISFFRSVRHVPEYVMNPDDLLLDKPSVELSNSDQTPVLNAIEQAVILQQW
jgi:hypothetical protein